ncbi:twin-arginine translocation signal domain-containing protein [Halorarius litoreus]|uniref:twin-arginine translocation signal domain-containing protein n=1 Tax=Halorarius litoreus TaxID=2962676 RepID=UPI0020CF64D8|nr:succinylglutamate desuccinylase/aspartoacylase family protein [Halorarius litoreus]
MSPTLDSDARTADARCSRRRFLQAATATGVGLAALSTASSTASAARSSLRDQYQIRLGTPDEQTVYYYRAEQDGPTTMVIGGIHGDERAGYLAADQIREWTVDRGELVVVPRANPAAIADDLRPWDNDLNRQFPPRGGDCLSPLADTLWDVVEHHDPDWVFDLHSSRGIYKSDDGGVGQALFPTWTDPARPTGEQTVAALNERFGLSGDMAYLMGNTLDADRDMLMHRVAGVLDRPGFICETTEKAPLDEQVAWHLFTVEHAMAQFGQTRVTDQKSTTQTTQTTPDRHEIVIQGAGPETRYEFKATESVTPIDEPEWNDYVYSRGVNGAVSTGEDRFYFEGSLEYVEVKEGDAADLTVTVDGREISAEPNTRTIQFEGTGPAVRYEFKATESVTPVDEPEWNDYVYSRGVNGEVTSGVDRFTFVGDLEYVEVTEGDASDLAVYVDGLPFDL